MIGRATKTKYRQSKKGMNIACLPNSTQRRRAQSREFVDEPLPDRVYLFTLGERIPRDGSFHPHQGAGPTQPCWTNHNDSRCRMFSPFSAAIRRTPAGLRRRIRKNTWPLSFIWFSGTTPANDGHPFYFDLL